MLSEMLGCWILVYGIMSPSGAIAHVHSELRRGPQPILEVVLEAMRRWEPRSSDARPVRLVEIDIRQVDCPLQPR